MTKRKKGLLFTVASWEERFVAGLRACIDEGWTSKLVMWYMKEYEAWSKENRLEIFHVCRRKGVEIVEEPLSMEDPVGNWRALEFQLTSSNVSSASVMVDITTTPREILWSLFWLLEQRQCEIHYSYQQPKTYNKEWLSRDPGTPRLVYKLSGVADPMRRTVFLVVVGFDVRRTARVVRFFEPEKTLLGLQTGSPFEINNEKMRLYEQRFSALESSDIFALDAYSSDHGREEVLSALSPWLEGYNIIMTSLGPKPSAVALYQLQRRYPAIGLVYAPARDFNKYYSSGVGERLVGCLRQRDSP